MSSEPTMTDAEIVLQALNDWVVTYAYDFADESDVEAAKVRLNENGPLHYITLAIEAAGRINRSVEGAQGASGGEVKPIGFVHPLYLDGRHLAMEVSTVRLSPIQVPVYLGPTPATGSGGEAVAIVIDDVVGVELAWMNPPSHGRPPVGTKLYTRPAPAGGGAGESSHV